MNVRLRVRDLGEGETENGRVGGWVRSVHKCGGMCKYDLDYSQQSLITIFPDMFTQDSNLDRPCPCPPVHRAVFCCRLWYQTEARISPRCLWPHLPTCCDWCSPMSLQMPWTPLPHQSKYHGFILILPPCSHVKGQAWTQSIHCSFGPESSIRVCSSLAQ